MSKLLIFLYIFLIGFTACKNSDIKENISGINSDSLAALGYYGTLVNADSAWSVERFLEFLEGKDSLALTLAGRIADNCQHSGCWMELDLENGHTMRVKFKDEKFTIPLDSKGKNALLSGMAYRKVITVEELKKIALDEGFSQEDVDTIKTPESEITFLATGVFIKEN